jgi:hypothetical protein
MKLGFVFCGKELRSTDFRRIQRLIDAELKPTREQIARETCRIFGWRRPGGAPPVRACRDLLVRLGRMGVIRLPALRRKTQSATAPRPRIGPRFLLGPTPGWTGSAGPAVPLEVRPIAVEELRGFRAYT